MKQSFAIVILLHAAITAVAFNMAIFSGWDNLIERSPNIFIARRPVVVPSAAIESTNRSKITATVDGVTLCPIEIIFSLKGTAKPGPAQLLLIDSFQRGGVSPHQGELFLVCADNCEADNATNSIYHAAEDYRIVVIGPDNQSAAWTNALAGKPVRKQVKYVLKYRLDTLNEELTRDQAEKQRVEAGLKEL